jgi:hypothetical protein
MNRGADVSAPRFEEEEMRRRSLLAPLIMAPGRAATLARAPFLCDVERVCRVNMRGA